MSLITITKVNEVYVRAQAEPGIAMEMKEYFKFAVPGAKFSPAYRNKFWDGFIYLYNPLTSLIYTGLVQYIEEFAKSRDYTVKYLTDFPKVEFSLSDAEKFIEALKPKMQPRDYQMNAFVHAVSNNRSLLLSPTASGKSFIIYLLVRYYAERTLIIVPTTSLVSQLASDFADYGFNSDAFVHRIYSGQDKSSTKPITISTWQSIFKMPKEFFKQFNVVIGDEAHLFKAKSLTSILTKLEDCQYRFGFTGTLDGSQTNKLVLEGLFGPVRKIVSTTELIEKKHLADFRIKAIVLKYPDQERKTISKVDFQTEIDYIVRLEARNKFICNLALSLEGNTLLLFQFVEKHGKELYDKLSSESSRKIFFVSGSVSGEEREKIRKIVEEENNAIIVASYGVFSTGVNIKNLHNIIFSSPSKSRIRNLQSIGRVLRKSENKTQSTLFDIADDLSWKNKKNFTILHFMERIKIYNEEQFPYKVYNVDINL